MNILIKLMSIVSLVIAPTLAIIHHDKIEANRKAQIENLQKISASKETIK
jgi:K(+)-stimulated pyrophosphate-energized sodium pump